jgi:hypothetical protein
MMYVTYVIQLCYMLSTADACSIKQLITILLNDGCSSILVTSFIENAAANVTISSQWNKVDIFNSRP